jgi:heme-degrading monooxygenase HmoA
VSEVFTTGSWRPFEGQEEEFLSAWRDFAGWASTLPGAGTATLARDLRDPARFVSFMGWETIEAVQAWKSSPEFKPRMSVVQQHIDEFAPTELEVVASIGEPVPRA